MSVVNFIMEFIVEYLIVLFVYTIVSYLQKKFSKKSKWKFSIWGTIKEAWSICLVIALVIVITNHVI